MKIAVVGKGGAGKTTASAVIARTFSRGGRSTLALDCDPNPNLGISLGLGEEVTEQLIALREAVGTGEEEHATGLEDLVARFGVVAPDGVRMAVVAAIENPEPGCPCCGISPEQLLGRFARPELVVVADFEGGLGTLMRLAGNPVDIVVVVVEPTEKSLEVGRRAVGLVHESDLGRVVVMANRVSDDADARRVIAAFPGVEVVVVPEDPAVVAAERRGVAPTDVDGASPGVAAIAMLAEHLMAQEPAPAVTSV